MYQQGAELLQLCYTTLQLSHKEQPVVFCSIEHGQNWNIKWAETQLRTHPNIQNKEILVEIHFKEKATLPRFFVIFMKKVDHFTFYLRMENNKNVFFCCSRDRTQSICSATNQFCKTRSNNFRALIFLKPSIQAHFVFLLLAWDNQWMSNMVQKMLITNYNFFW